MCLFHQTILLICNTESTNHSVNVKKPVSIRDTGFFHCVGLKRSSILTARYRCSIIFPEEKLISYDNFPDRHLAFERVKLHATQ